MTNAVFMMYKHGAFKRKFGEIIEIYPRQSMNSYAFKAAIEEISRTHNIVKMTNEWYRAFPKK